MSLFFKGLEMFIVVNNTINNKNVNYFIFPELSVCSSSAMNFHQTSPLLDTKITNPDLFFSALAILNTQVSIRAPINNINNGFKFQISEGYKSISQASNEFNQYILYQNFWQMIQQIIQQSQPWNENILIIKPKF